MSAADAARGCLLHRSELFKEAREIKTIYIAGPMTGYEDYNYPAFFAAEARFRDAGWEVLNPARHPTDWITSDMDPDVVRAAYMKMDIEDVMAADAIALLPGWQASKGANVELAVARILLKDVYDAETGEPYADESILVEADRLVSVDRQADYGHPIDDFSRSAAMWSAILGIEVQAEQIPLCMIAVKMSRELNRAKRDNLVDIAGYAKTLALVHEERQRRAA